MQQANKTIFFLYALLIIVIALGSYGLSYQPYNKMVIYDQYGTAIDSTESYGYDSIDDMARDYRIKYYEENGTQIYIKYPNCYFIKTK